MLKSTSLPRFIKEVEKAKKRGRDIEKLMAIMILLAKQEPLPEKFRNHKLKGKFLGCWECHIEPDWLLIYEKTQT